MDRLEELKKYPSLVPHNTILNYCPYYFEMEEYLKGIKLPTKEEIIHFVSNHSHESAMYQSLSVNEKLVKGMDVQFQILHNADFRYD